MPQLIDGKKVADKIKLKIKDEINSLKNKYAFPGPGLAVVLVGDNPASCVYVNMKKKACAEVGIISYEYVLDKNIEQKKIEELILKLNADDKIHGILIQLPLPGHIKEDEVLWQIDPLKDVDGFHPVNVGKMLLGKPVFLPCTPLGVQVLLEEYKIETQGKHVVIVGRSNIVGKPLATMLLQKGKFANATVTVCHSQTKDISSITKQADILIAAIGKPKFITEDMVKSGAVVIDVGVNRLTDKKLAGDVDFDAVSKKALAITPVPGGVGPMTIAMLMQNTLKSFKINKKLIK